MVQANSTYKLASGHAMPVLGYGTYETSPEVTAQVVTQALQTGYRQIDSAAFYENESGCGSAIASSKLPRESIFYTSKLHFNNMGYDATKAAVTASLKEAGVSYLDLYLIHAPFGDATARNGSWKALAEAVQAGQIRSIGVSNYGVPHLEELRAYRATLGGELGKVPISVAQYELHPWMRRKEIVGYAEEHGIVLQAFGPLVVAKKANDPVLTKVAAKHGKKWSQVLVRWSLQQGFSPLPKSVTESRIKENYEVFDFELDAQDLKDLETDAYELNREQWDPVTWGFNGPAW